MIPTYQDTPISIGWWWLQFCDGPGPRFWDGTFWKQGSYFSAAEDYAEFPIIGPCLPPTTGEIKRADGSNLIGPSRSTIV
jgi:hypothetical protein